jgi:hypothetical protein
MFRAQVFFLNFKFKFSMAIHPMTGNTQNSSVRDLQQKLIECALTCEDCERACLNEDNITLMARCIELDRDCADICLQAARLLKRDAEIADDFLVVCEKMCRMCAEECRKHNQDHCRNCAEVCETCADACHAVV